MKNVFIAAIGVVFVGLSSQVMAEAGPAPAHHIEIGKKVYERAFGRGCGACHDMKSNPQLHELIVAGKLPLDAFTKTLKEGKGNMPKAIDQIMELAPVKTANLSEAEAIQAVYDYLKGKK
jgi:hypothetical protein